MGWKAVNVLKHWGIVADVAGWAITIATLLLGVPFWFDALSRLARLRGSGAEPRAMSDTGGQKAST